MITLKFLRPWMMAAAVSLNLGICVGYVSAQEAKPNIVLLLADDLGYGELGSYGQKVISTPRLDELANAGIRFEQVYAGSPVCSPSRGVLMTGKHAGNATIRSNIGLFPNGVAKHLALTKDEMTVAEMLKGAGYQTAFVGKWHLDLANQPDTWAFARGFDFSVQEQWGAAENDKFRDERHWVNGVTEYVDYVMDDYDCLDEFRTDMIMRFLDEKDDEKPFFIFMSYRAPHGNEKRIGNKTMYADRGWHEDKRRHATVVSLLDREVGRLLDRLEKDGDMENTLVIFTSDNGPHKEGGKGYSLSDFGSAGGLRGYKRDVYEGGVRVPMICSWKGKIAAGGVSKHIGTLYDVMATAAEVAGISEPEQSDGISFLPELLGKEQEEHVFVYSELLLYKGLFMQGARQGKWKAVRYGAKSAVQLFDLEKDPGEKNDVARQFPEKASELDKVLQKAHTDTPGCVIGEIGVN
ncbi:MAG: sulfatase-like hydrolase/transferase [Akkermansiaceae bacterium]